MFGRRSKPGRQRGPAAAVAPPIDDNEIGRDKPVEPWRATAGSIRPQGTTPIGEVKYRTRARIKGKVRSVRVRPWADVPALECTVVDDTGGITVVFLGRRSIGGIGPGTLITAEGVVGQHHDRLAIMNPAYDLRRF